MKRITLLVLLISFLTTVSTPLKAEDTSIPQPASQFYVLDQADILDQNMNRPLFRLLSTCSKRQRPNRGVYHKQPNERAPEDYALAILRGWGIGDKI